VYWYHETNGDDWWDSQNEALIVKGQFDTAEETIEWAHRQVFVQYFAPGHFEQYFVAAINGMIGQEITGNQRIMSRDEGTLMVRKEPRNSAGGASVPKTDQKSLPVISVEDEAISEYTQAISIGDTGPAGGTVFYDKGSYSDGWRYLEATPDLSEFYEDSDFYATNWFPYTSSHVHDPISGTDTAIGSGKQNTEIIVAYFSSVGESGMDQGGRKAAAKLCADLDYGGKTDWFLPSKDELNQMYLNLKGYHPIRSNSFWSSSQADSENAWVQNLTDGLQFPDDKKYETAARAVRYF
jgi:hypothetical protein